jgi:Rho-binding antiterminator
MTDERYIPVNETLFEELETLALLHKNCEIKFIHEGATLAISSVIMSVFSLDDGYFIRTSTGLHIRLDKLISLNGKEVSYFC